MKPANVANWGVSEGADDAAIYDHTITDDAILEP